MPTVVRFHLCSRLWAADLVMGPTVAKTTTAPGPCLVTQRRVVLAPFVGCVLWVSSRASTSLLQPVYTSLVRMLRNTYTHHPGWSGPDIVLPLSFWRLKDLFEACKLEFSKARSQT